MTTTYELYTNENGTPKAVEGKAPAIIERVETLETSVESLEETLDNGVVTSVNGKTGAVSLDVGVTSFNGSKGAVTYSAPVSSVNGKTGAVTVDVGVTSVNGKTGAVTVSVPPTPKAYVTEAWKNGKNWYRKWSDGWIEQGGLLASSGTGTKTVTLHKAFSNTNYTFIQQAVSLKDNYGAYYSAINAVTTTTVKVSVGSNFSTGLYWYACGY